MILIPLGIGIGLIVAINTIYDSTVKRGSPTSATKAGPTATVIQSTPMAVKVVRRDPKVEQLVHEFIREGYLRVDVKNEKAFITPVMWLTLDAQGKENLTRAVALYCSPEYPSVEIIDNQSARKLASYGPFQGFKVY